MSVPTNLAVTAGLPFSHRVRVVDGKNVWPTLDEVEARMHVRVSEEYTSRLKYDFTPHLAKSFELDDLVVEWALTGSETKALRSGFYDLILSDIGGTDVRAIRAIHGYLDVRPITTNVGGL